jgi:Nitroreductase family
MSLVRNPAMSAALERAAEQAILAPSVHNTQPWRFVIRPGAFEVRADFSRQLEVIDPDARELIISCGAALFNVRVSLAAAGFGTAVRRLPEHTHPDLLARVWPVGGSSALASLAVLDRDIVRRQTNRRRYAPEPVPPRIIDTIVRAAEDCSARLIQLVKVEDREAVARLSRIAEEQQILDPGYRAELRKWTTDESGRRDGIRALTVPRVGAASPDAGLRDFDTRGSGFLPAETGSIADDSLFVLGTEQDDPAAWLAAGEALEHVLLEITRLGYAASPLSQVTEVASTRADLRALLMRPMYPQVLLRVGLAPTAPGSSRRPLSEVLTRLDS